MSITYEEYRLNRQAEFNALPIFFAFSKEQFKEAMEERGLTENDTDKIYGLGSGVSGGFYLRSDADKIRAFMDKPDELPELMKDYDFAKSAFYYEMRNHEYAINWQADWDVCRCFCYEEELPYHGDESGELTKYFDFLGWDEQTRQAYRDARKQYYKAAEENDWF